MTFYSDWGFKSNPFDTAPLTISAQGSALMVGRDSEIKKIGSRLSNPTKIVTLEGGNGVGKTSLISVFLYRHIKEICAVNVGPLFIPCERFFQIEKDTSLADFKFKVFLEVASSIMKWKRNIEALRGKKKFQSETALRRFIHSPTTKEISAGVNVLASGGLSFGSGDSINDGDGFKRNGLEALVRKWLIEIFPTGEQGGIVCVIDNLELLQTSATAREMMEVFRDEIFNIHGIRWVLCGANGIVHGILSSTRLDGRLHKPILVKELQDRLADEIYKTRIRSFKDRPDASLPITQSNFHELYEILNGNIRSVLSDADEFCNWVADKVDDPDDFEESFFEQWLGEELGALYDGVSKQLRPRAWEVFDVACELAVFSPGDCLEFGYETPQAMRQQLRPLEQAGLIRSDIDDTDKRRKTTSVTSKGWKLRAYLDYYDAE